MNAPEFGTIRKAFVDLADTLAGDFDILAFLDTLSGYCVELLPVDASGVLLAEYADQPALIRASTEQTRALMIAELDGGPGPAGQSLGSSAAVCCPDLGVHAGRWPVLAPAALRYGLRAADALPMQLRNQTIGALVLYRAGPGALDPGAAELAKAITDAATIGIVHQRALHRKNVLAEQLQTALDSRVVIEQAKGVLAERLQVAIDDAFLTLRRYARNNNMKLTDTARAVAEGTLDIGGCLPQAPGGRSQGAPRRPLIRAAAARTALATVARVP